MASRFASDMQRRRFFHRAFVPQVSAKWLIFIDAISPIREAVADYKLFSFRAKLARRCRKRPFNRGRDFEQTIAAIKRVWG
ncbi:MAG: hypothetical protein II007_13620 [Gammaproteobacteria bacterium]|nr:hypothetical protein [Gammaproteobacteria bacterium]